MFHIPSGLLANQDVSEVPLSILVLPLGEVADVETYVCLFSVFFDGD